MRPSSNSLDTDQPANNGSVAQAGAIEDAAVRDAIMHTVDGGAEAFACGA